MSVGCCWSCWHGSWWTSTKCPSVRQLLGVIAEKTLAKRSVSSCEVYNGTTATFILSKKQELYVFVKYEYYFNKLTKFQYYIVEFFWYTASIRSVTLKIQNFSWKEGFHNMPHSIFLWGNLCSTSDVCVVIVLIDL